MPDLFDDDDFAPEPSDLPVLVRSVAVRGLFGRYSYRFTVPRDARSDRLVLFYGDNGRGKTTILRLLWHLLSPAPKRSHRSRIAKIPFQSFEVCLEDGKRFQATRPTAVAGPYEMTVFGSDGQVQSQGEWPSSSNPFSEWSIEAINRVSDLPADLQDDARSEILRRKYLGMLADLDAKPYYLADDRNIYSDELEDRGKDRRVREEQLRWNRGGQSESEDLENSNVAAELQISMARTNDLLRRITLGGTQSGSANANAVYLEVLTRLAAASPEIGPQPDLLDRLHKRVLHLAERSRPFEDLRLVPEFPGDRFASTLRSLTEENAGVAEEVLGTFLSSLDARLDALASAESLISTFLKQTNGFLSDKRIAFTPQTGLRIVTEDGRLSPRQLSSGERQLILLLCNALLARQGSRIFLIDEPELSLNVKWQRKIVDALLETTHGTPVQFFIATHSVELLSNYRSNVVRLEDIVE